MGFFSQLLAGTPAPDADFWYRPTSEYAESGQRVDVEAAQKVSAYYRGVELLSTSLAMLPLNIWKRLPNNGGRDVARDYYLHDVIHSKPNIWQDSFRWRRQKMRHLLHHGNGYDFIVAGRRGFVEELRPIHPSRVKPEQIASGRVVYHVRDPKTQTKKIYTQDDIFHLCGPSDDGVEGKGVLEYAKTSLGLALATESYASKLFSQGALHGGLIKVPGLLDPEASKRMAESFVTSSKNWHTPKVLEQGAEWVSDGIDPEKAQMILSRKFSIDDIARWLGLPPHMIGSLDRSTNNNIEQQGQEFVTYSLGPWLSLFEFGISDQLVIQQDTYYAEFVRDALVRGDIATRWTAHVEAVNAGIKTADEVREVENLNRRGGKADELREPANIVGKPGAANGVPPKKAPKLAAPESDRAMVLAMESSSRLLRKEQSALAKLATKNGGQTEFMRAAEAFYATHQALVQQTMQISEHDARTYCTIRTTELRAFGLKSAEEWTPDLLAGWAVRG